MRLAVCLIFIFCSAYAFGQYDPDYRRSRPRNEDSEPSMFNLGVGLGLNYGGFGGRLEITPQKYVALFAAAGFNLHKLGFNAGAKLNLMPDKKVSPMLQFMYGYNAVIVILGASQNNKTYYGPTIGGGIQLKVGQRNNFMEFGLLIPFRSQDFTDDLKALQSGGADLTEPTPVAITAGYHFRI